MRRARWFSVIGSATLGLAGLVHSLESAARGADPQSPPRDGSVIEASGGAAADDPFAPIRVEQILPASSQMPSMAVPASSALGVRPAALPAATIMAPMPAAATLPAPLAAPAPVAASTMMMPPAMQPGGMPAQRNGMGPMMGGAPQPGMSMASALQGGCGSCGGAASGGCCDEVYDGLLDNAEFTFLFDTFKQVGGFDRVGGSMGLNWAAPVTHDGWLGFQFGGRLEQAELGGQAFLTTGFFHHCNPCGGLALSYGVVYDFMYDNWMNFEVSQLRFKIGNSFTSRDEVGTWFTVPVSAFTVSKREDSRVRILSGFPELISSLHDTHLDPVNQGHMYWQHIFHGGWTTVLDIGYADDPHGWMFGGIVTVPVNDCWAVTGGGYGREESASYDAYLGLAYYPGGRAHRCGSCGPRYMPYLDVADNTSLNVTVERDSDITLERVIHISQP